MGSSTARFSDTYIYGVGIVSALAIDVCVLFVCNNKSPQAANKEQQQLIKPKRGNMFRYDSKKNLKKSIEDTIKDALIVAATTTEIFSC